MVYDNHSGKVLNIYTKNILIFKYFNLPKAMFRKLFISLLLLLASNMPLLAKCLQSLYSPDRNIQLVINQEQEHIMATVKYLWQYEMPGIFKRNCNPRAILCHPWEEELLRQYWKCIHHVSGESTKAKTGY